MQILQMPQGNKIATASTVRINSKAPKREVEPELFLCVPVELSAVLVWVCTGTVVVTCVVVWVVVVVAAVVTCNANWLVFAPPGVKS